MAKKKIAKRKPRQKNAPRFGEAILRVLVSRDFLARGRFGGALLYWIGGLENADELEICNSVQDFKNTICRKQKYVNGPY